MDFKKQCPSTTLSVTVQNRSLVNLKSIVINHFLSKFAETTHL